MAGAREIRRRIRSVKNIAQITKAMELVAASKMRRAQDAATASRHYRQTIDQLLQQVHSAAEPDVHPLLHAPTEQTSQPDLVIVFGPDKGLCGGLVTNLLKVAAEQIRDYPNSQFVTMGKKSRDGVIRLGGQLMADFPLHDRPRLGHIIPLAQLIVDEFQSHRYGRVMIIYTDFINIMRQQATITQLLPLGQVGLLQAEGKPTEMTDNGKGDHLFEPDQATVLSQLLPRYLEMLLYQSLLESQASEHSARMMAMKSAGDNAHEIEEELTLTYNQLRQASITAELAEIAAATS